MRCGLLWSMISGVCQSVCNPTSLCEHGWMDRGPAPGGDFWEGTLTKREPRFLPTDSMRPSPSHFRRLFLWCLSVCVCCVTFMAHAARRYCYRTSVSPSVTLSVTLVIYVQTVRATQHTVSMLVLTHMKCNCSAQTVCWFAKTVQVCCCLSINTQLQVARNK